MTLASRLRWFLGRLIAPVRTLGTGDAPPDAEPDEEPEEDSDDS